MQRSMYQSDHTVHSLPPPAQLCTARHITWRCPCPESDHRTAQQHAAVGAAACSPHRAARTAAIMCSTTDCTGQPPGHGTTEHCRGRADGGGLYMYVTCRTGTAHTVMLIRLACRYRSSGCATRSAQGVPGQPGTGPIQGKPPTA
jgi:hypothetical protein